MANKNVTLTDDDGNILYPATLASNVSGLDGKIEAIANQKANIDASNVQQNTYANLAFPDYDNRLTFTNNQIYKAPCDGYVYDKTAASPTHWCTVIIYDSAGEMIYFVEESYDGNNYNEHTHIVPIAKGYRFKTTDRSDYRYFIPCRGAVLSGEWTGSLPTATV